MSEFDAIKALVEALGATSTGGDLLLGPGDDAALVKTAPDQDWVSSIDALVAGVHFPVGAHARLVGYRALMVSASDLAAMGAHPSYALIALTLPQDDRPWLVGFAEGVAEAAHSLSLRIGGGNLARGPLNIAVSVHGHCPAGTAITRAGAQVGDAVYVTGRLGGAARAVRECALDAAQPDDTAEWIADYYRPRARVDEGVLLRGVASSAIDVSDGLLQDADHIAGASKVALALDSSLIPLSLRATLTDALHGGDDYELIFTASESPPALECGVTRIGEVIQGSGVLLDGERVAGSGYRHFAEPHA